MFSYAWLAVSVLVLAPNKIGPFLSFRDMYMANPDLRDICLDPSIITLSVLRIFESWVSRHAVSWHTSIYTRLAAIHD